VSASPQLAHRTIDQLLPMDFPPLPEWPLVSVLIGNYNYARYIGEAIDSVLAQTYQNFEICICDDGSKDNSVEVIRRYAALDPRIKLIAQENRGHGAALNSAWSLAVGAVITLLDADDIFSPDKLQVIVDFMRGQRNVGFVAHSMVTISGTGEHMERIPIFTQQSGWIGQRVLRRGGRWCVVPCSALSFRAEIAHLVFPMDELLFRTVADAFVFTLLPIFASTGFVSKDLAMYRLHGANVTAPQQLDVQTLDRSLDDLARVIGGVNARLQALGSTSQLRIEDHLSYWRLTFARAILRRDPKRAQLKILVRLLSEIASDDIFRFDRKCLYGFIYATAVLCPHPIGRLLLKAWDGPGSPVRRFLRRVFDHGNSLGNQSADDQFASPNA
jgi:hypothetical protein